MSADVAEVEPQNRLAEQQALQPDGSEKASGDSVPENNADANAVDDPASLQARHGLKWEANLFGLEPRWTAEPDVSVLEDISRQQLQLAKDARCSVTFQAQGGFNKLYKIETDTGTWMMRVALPVDPYRKTASEVATMHFVRYKTSAPVPKVLAHDASGKSALSFEWILMEYMPGQPLGTVSRKLPMSKKEAMVRQIALYQSQLYHERFHRIGNIYQHDATSYSMGRIVSMSFFWGDRGAREVDRGPFRNSNGWLSTRLKLVREDQDHILQSSDDEDDIEDAERAKNLAHRLDAILPEIFPADEEEEETVIFHDDINHQNILIDDNGDLTAILDWECVSAFPTWKVCSFPSFLEGRTREEAPDRGTYSKYNPEIDRGTEDENDGKTQLYREHCEDYERAQLRPIFLAEMQRLAPGWVESHRQAALKQDFELAVLHCDGALTMKRVEVWLAAYTDTNGAPHSLREVFNR